MGAPLAGRQSIDSVREPISAREFGRGFAAMFPLWAGAIPVGIAYGVAAREAGIGALETQLMSLTVFSAAGQVTAVSLLSSGTSPAVLVGTVMALNAQLLLLGLTAGRQLRLSTIQRMFTAWFLTDGAFGVTAAQGKLRLSVLLGAGVSMFTGWNIGTALGVVAGGAIPDLQRLGLDFVVTLAFLAVLVPLIRSRPMVVAMLASCAVAFALNSVAPGGLTVLGAGVAGAAAGVAWSRRSTGSRATDTGGARP